MKPKGSNKTANSQKDTLSSANSASNGNTRLTECAPKVHSFQFDWAVQRLIQIQTTNVTIKVCQLINDNAKSISSAVIYVNSDESANMIEKNLNKNDRKVWAQILKQNLTMQTSFYPTKSNSINWPKVYIIVITQGVFKELIQNHSLPNHINFVINVTPQLKNEREYEWRIRKKYTSTDTHKYHGPVINILTKTGQKELLIIILKMEQIKVVQKDLAELFVTVQRNGFYKKIVQPSKRQQQKLEQNTTTKTEGVQIKVQNQSVIGWASQVILISYTIAQKQNILKDIFTIHKDSFDRCIIFDTHQREAIQTAKLIPEEVKTVITNAKTDFEQIVKDLQKGITKVLIVTEEFQVNLISLKIPSRVNLLIHLHIPQGKQLKVLQSRNEKVINKNIQSSEKTGLSLYFIPNTYIFGQKKQIISQIAEVGNKTFQSFDVYGNTKFNFVSYFDVPSQVSLERSNKTLDMFQPNKMNNNSVIKQDFPSDTNNQRSKTQVKITYKDKIEGNCKQEQLVNYYIRKITEKDQIAPKIQSNFVSKQSSTKNYMLSEVGNKSQQQFGELFTKFQLKESNCSNFTDRLILLGINDATKKQESQQCAYQSNREYLKSLVNQNQKQSQRNSVSNKQKDNKINQSQRMPQNLQVGDKYPQTFHNQQKQNSIFGFEQEKKHKVILQEKKQQMQNTVTLTCKRADSIRSEDGLNEEAKNSGTVIQTISTPIQKSTMHQKKQNQIQLQSQIAKKSQLFSSFYDSKDTKKEKTINLQSNTNIKQSKRLLNPQLLHNQLHKHQNTQKSQEPHINQQHKHYENTQNPFNKDLRQFQFNQNHQNIKNCQIPQHKHLLSPPNIQLTQKQIKPTNSTQLTSISPQIHKIITKLSQMNQTEIYLLEKVLNQTKVITQLQNSTKTQIQKCIGDQTTKYDIHHQKQQQKDQKITVKLQQIKSLTELTERDTKSILKIDNKIQNNQTLLMQQFKIWVGQQKVNSGKIEQISADFHVKLSQVFQQNETKQQIYKKKISDRQKQKYRKMLQMQKKIEQKYAIDGQKVLVERNNNSMLELQRKLTNLNAIQAKNIELQRQLQQKDKSLKQLNTLKMLAAQKKQIQDEYKTKLTTQEKEIKELKKNLDQSKHSNERLNKDNKRFNEEVNNGKREIKTVLNSMKISNKTTEFSTLKECLEVYFSETKAQQIKIKSVMQKISKNGENGVLPSADLIKKSYQEFRKNANSQITIMFSECFKIISQTINQHTKITNLNIKSNTYINELEKCFRDIEILFKKQKLPSIQNLTTINLVNPDGHQSPINRIFSLICQKIVFQKTRFTNTIENLAKTSKECNDAVNSNIKYQQMIEQLNQKIKNKNSDIQSLKQSLQKQKLVEQETARKHKQTEQKYKQNQRKLKSLIEQQTIKIEEQIKKSTLLKTQLQYKLQELVQQYSNSIDNQEKQFIIDKQTAVNEAVRKCEQKAMLQMRKSKFEIESEKQAAKMREIQQITQKYDTILQTKEVEFQKMKLKKQSLQKDLIGVQKKLCQTFNNILEDQIYFNDGNWKDTAENFEVKIQQNIRQLLILPESRIYNKLSAIEKQFIIKNVARIVEVPIQKIQRTKTLFCASTNNDNFWDGWHQKIMDKPNLLLMMTLQNGYKIGGFSSKPFSPQQKANSTQGFIMTITNRQCYDAKQKPEFPIAFYDKYGFTLGNQDLNISVNGQFTVHLSKRSCKFATMDTNLMKFHGQQIQNGKFVEIEFHQVIFD